MIAWSFTALLFFFGRTIVASIAGGLGTLTFLLAVFSPAGAYRALSGGIDRFASMVGRVLAWILLAPVFLLFFVPFRLLLRRGSADTLARGFDRARPSYWSRHDRVADLEKPY